MNAEIISIGTELLMGEITDTNAQFLARELPALGINLFWVSQVGDNQARLVEVLRRAWGRSGLILTSGGLGPTADDITREAIAETVGETVAVDETLALELREFFRRMGRDMPESNLKQATLIPSARALRNSSGTAPGWWVEKDARILVALPGPPREIRPMWQHEVLPHLLKKAAGGVIVSRTLKLFNISEAHVGELVASRMLAANPTLGVYAKGDGIHLRIGAKAPSREAAQAMIAPLEAELQGLLGKHIWGFDDDTLDIVAGRRLAAGGESLAVMESYTGGLLAATITGLAGSEGFFKGGLVAGAGDTSYGVNPGLLDEQGAESPALAGAMAEAARERFGATIGLGIAGHDKAGDSGSIVGTFHIGLVSDKGRKVMSQGYPGERSRVRQWAVSAALFELAKLLAPDSSLRPE